MDQKSPPLSSPSRWKENSLQWSSTKSHPQPASHCRLLHHGITKTGREHRSSTYSHRGRFPHKHNKLKNVQSIFLYRSWKLFPTLPTLFRHRIKCEIQKKKLLKWDRDPKMSTDEMRPGFSAALRHENLSKIAKEPAGVGEVWTKLQAKPRKNSPYFIYIKFLNPTLESSGDSSVQHAAQCCHGETKHFHVSGIFANDISPSLELRREDRDSHCGSTARNSP